ncbi:MAG: 50S ribosomal protein L25 [Puniceicoccales bacterium]|jgi:large subunit ribosomal protein L25|nr:50S ribosomal protein L25 [Puniceicoccales bacterium]
MENLELIAEVRADRSRGSLRRARKAGRIPATIYGESGNAALYLDDKKLRAVLRRIAGGAAIVSVKVRGESRNSVVADFQRDPIGDGIVHVDFHEISMAKKMHANLPVILVGADECIGVKAENAILDLVSHSLEIRCMPMDLPSGFHVDVSKLHAGEAIHVKDLAVGDGVEFAAPPDHVIVICSAMKTGGESEAAAADGAAASPAPAPVAGAKDGGKAKS